MEIDQRPLATRRPPLRLERRLQAQAVDECDQRVGLVLRSPCRRSQPDDPVRNSATAAATIRVGGHLDPALQASAWPG